MLPQPHHPCPEAHISPDGTVIHFAGHNLSLDEVIVQGIRGQLFALAREASPANVILDFCNVGYVSSLALDTLLTLHNKLWKAGRRLALRNLSPPVYEIFALTRLDQVLDAHPEAADAEDAAADDPPVAPVGILVVDDNMVVLRFLAAGLRCRGFKVWLAGDGHQAIQLFRQRRDEIAAVLLDVRMPGMNGPQTLMALRRLCPTIRFCFMTGDADPDTKAALFRLGAARVFPKPFNLAEVTQTLDKMVGKASFPGQHRWIDLS